MRILSALTLLLSGCAALQFQTAPVIFPAPFFQPDFSNLETPTPEEAAGVLLRLKVPEAGTLRYGEKNILFARAEADRGLKVELDMERTEHFSPGASAGTFIRTAEINILKGGTVTEKAEMNERGEVIRFIEGKHRSDIGKFKIRDLKRNGFFPEESVHPGSSWSYTEEMSLEVQSFWVRQKGPSTHRIEATSELKGFQNRHGRRTAVIYTTAKDVSVGNFSILFKGITVSTTAEIEEITYFDYTAGVVVEKITNTRSLTELPGLGVTDEGKAQLVSRLEERATNYELRVANKELQTN